MNDMQDILGAERSFAENEHRELAAGLEDMETVASAVGWTTPADLSRGIRRIRSWIGAVLVPHAAWEDAVLYNEIDERAHTEWATKLMRYEHHQIARAAAKLESDADLVAGAMSHEQACALRSHLSGLAALLRAHIERENLFLLPLLGEIGPASATGAASSALAGGGGR